MQLFILFNIGAIVFGMPLPLTKSIHRADAVLKKQSGGDIGGTLSIDGEEIPLYDLSTVFSMETSASGLSGKKIVIAEDEDQVMGLIVDRVGRVISVQENQIEPLPPVFKGRALDCFPQVLARDNDLILLVKPAGIGAVAKHGNA
jgi:chemotaxis signal transduction protein